MNKLLMFILLLPLFIRAQKLPGIAEKTTGMQRMNGLFPIYFEPGAGKLWLQIDQFDAEFLYVMSMPGGLGSNDIGLDRGLLGGGRVVSFQRSGRKVLMTEPNYEFRAVSDDPLERRAVRQSFARSVLWGFQVEAETDGKVLIDLTEFLTRDAMQAANRIRRMQQGNYTLDRNRSILEPEGTRNFPLNTEMEASITLVNADGITGEMLRNVVPSPEAITLRMHHSFVQLPDNGFRPRTFDPRSGFIPTSYFDYASPVATPIGKQLAIRHRLEKKDPKATISDPVKPIIYYLDNGTPEPIRTALLKGAAWWDQAFAAAGYRNAFQVKMLPDSADPMDIRYNVINWVHRSTRGWSYGASVVDPRTGEIIKGQVSLGSLRVRQDYLIAQALLGWPDGKSGAEDPLLKMSLDRLEQLSAHEVGHTLGLMHNYASSVNDRASVMDYPHPVVKVDGRGGLDLTSAYAKGIGAWDKLAIEWGYQHFPTGVDEPGALDAVLQKGIRAGYLFISDRDARAPGGAHPKAHLWDNGSDAVAGLRETMKVRSIALSRFGERNLAAGRPMAELEDLLVPAYLYHRYQIEAVTKLIGGVDYAYALKGDGQAAPRIVEKAKQLKALDAILDCLHPSFLRLPKGLAGLIPPRPAGIEYTKELFKKRTGLLFDALAPAETAADLPLSFLFHPERLSRMVQQETEGGLGLSVMIDRILSATWRAPRLTGEDGLIQRQTEQIVLTYLLAASIDEQSSFAARAAVGMELSRLKAFIESVRKRPGLEDAYAAHLDLALTRMKSPEKARPTIHLPAPPGAPIGCE
ncbi:MAG: zinc-dependent metalloprotease [Chitinophagaceae bacterium]